MPCWEYIQTKSKVLFKIYSRSSLLFSYFFSISNEGLTSKVKLSLLMRHCWSFVSLGHSELCIYCNLQHLIERGQSGSRSISTWQRKEKWKQFICTNLNNSSQSPFLYLRIDNSCIFAHNHFRTANSRVYMKAVMELTDSMNPGVKIKPFTPLPSQQGIGAASSELLNLS